MKTFLKEKWWNNLEPSPYLWAIFSWPPSFSEFQKQVPLFLGGGGNYEYSK